MATRVEERFGVANSVGQSYVIVGSQVAVSTVWNLILHFANLLTSTVKVRAYIADTSWSSGAPAGGTLI